MEILFPVLACMRHSILTLCSRLSELNKDFSINTPFHLLLSTLLFSWCKTLKELPEGPSSVSVWNLAAYSLLKVCCLFCCTLLSKRTPFNNPRAIFMEWNHKDRSKWRYKNFSKILSIFLKSNLLTTQFSPEMDWGVISHSSSPRSTIKAKDSKPKSGVTQE